MLTILSLFGRSPFAPLQAHMESVAGCVHKLSLVYEALEQKNYPLLERLAAEISELEHNADLIKNDIRNRLPKSLFLPIDRGNFLEILTLQDRIADKAEDVAVLATLKPLELLPIFQEEFKLFLQKNLETFDCALLVIKELNDLVESSFGGIEATKVQEMIAKVAYKEHETDIIQRDLLKNLFKAEDLMSYSTFFLWQKLFESLSAISNLSETLAHRVRMTLEVK
jgi:predicted phosphate transport protein (TIGR00153 family)